MTRGRDRDAARIGWREPFENRAVNGLHAEAFGHDVLDDDWRSQVESHSLGWVCAWDGAGVLAAFANVAWDGGVHAFLVDVIVRRELRRRGLGTRLVERAIAESRAAGCEWLHVDFEPHLRRFYLDACGFAATDAGVVDLTAR